MKTVFFDVDTQLDFLYPSGALSVPGALKIIEPLTELTRFAATNRIQIISTADAHTENDPEFKRWKPHCIAGATGQRKVAGTLMNQPLVLSTEPDALGAIRPHVMSASQIIVEKQAIDCFTNPNLRPLLDLLKADRYVVYGVITEYCVRCAAFGLLETGAQVELLTDAIKSLSPADEHAIMQHFQQRGGRLVKMKDFADALNS